MLKTREKGFVPPQDIRLIQDFLTLRFPNAFGAIVTGSFVTGKMNKESDIDLIVFETFLNEPFDEIFEFNKLKFHAIVTPVYSIADKLRDDITKGVGMFTELIVKGKVVKDNGRYLEKLIESLQIISANPSHYIKKINNYNTGLEIKKLLIELETLVDFEETIFCMLGLMEKLAKFHFRNINYWHESFGKHAAILFKKTNPLLHHKLILGYQEYITARNKIPFIETIKTYLESNGVPSSSYARGKHKIEITSTDYLFVNFKGISSSELFYNIVLVNFLSITQGVIEKNDCCAYNIYDSNSKEDIYCIRIDKHRNIINNRLLPRLRQAYLRGRISNQGVKIVVKYSFSPVRPKIFENEVDLKEFEKALFSELYESMIINGYNTNQTYFHVVYLLVLCGLALFKEPKQYESFLNQLCKLWLPLDHKFGPNDSYSHKKAQNIFSNYKKKYDSSTKKKFDSFFMPIIDNCDNSKGDHPYLKALNKIRNLYSGDSSRDFCSNDFILSSISLKQENTHSYLMLIESLLNVFGIKQIPRSYIIFSVKEIYLSSIISNKTPK